MLENPGLSLRQVAKAAAISPETVRDVRKRLDSGADLVPVRPGGHAGTSRPSPAVPSAVVRSMSLVRTVGRGPEPVIDRTAIVDRLKSDPALRYTETGRNLLRLLSLHAHWTEEWDAIVGNLPPHCGGVLADLATQFADLWADLARRTGQDVVAAG
jgi:hypothetical protein